ncbi:hypothetical protein ACFYZ9_09390 [Streptomyces sp. NPDC001691]|uniref:hypothetical protein n=1 Tax=Streptomyces sp. NPDC001691 TaxID=3364600 RepID=UPI0036C7984D
MSGLWSPETQGRPVETRLRAALAARADSITAADLRPADPPGSRARRTPWAGLRLRRFALPLAGLATAAAVAVGYVTLSCGQDEQRPLPADSPGPVQPPPTPSASAEPSVRPSPRPPRSPSAGRPKSSPAALSPSPSKAPGGPANEAPSRGASPRRAVPPPVPSAR